MTRQLGINLATMKPLLTTLMFVLSSIIFSNFSFAQGQVNLYTISEANPPSTICYPVSLVITGEMSHGYPFDTIYVSQVGADITINIIYNVGIAIFAWTPFSHTVDLGLMLDGTYNVTANTFLDGNPKDTLTHSLNVGPSSIIANFTYPVSMCAGEQVQLTNTSTGAVSQIWYENGIPQDTTVNYLFQPISPGVVVVRLRIINGSCQHAMQVNIPVYSPPSIDTFTASDTILCLGETVDFTSSSVDSVSYEWFENGISMANTNDHSVTPSSAGTFEYQLIIESAEGCKDSTNYFVDVLDLPNVDIGPDTIDCFGPIVLDAGSGLTYLWQDQSTNQTFIPTTTGIYSVTVTDANGCSNIDEMSFETCSGILENSGMNNTFYPNPVVSIVNIDIEGYEGQVSIRTTDMNGKSISELEQFTSGNVELDMSELHSGVYYVHLATNNSNVTLKIIKE